MYAVYSNEAPAESRAACSSTEHALCSPLTLESQPEQPRMFTHERAELPTGINPLALAGLTALVGEGATAALPAEHVISSAGSAGGPDLDGDGQHDAPEPQIEATGNVRAELPTGITPLAVAGLAALVGEGAAARTDRTDASTDRMLCSVLEAAKAEAAKAHILRAQAA